MHSQNSVIASAEKVKIDQAEAQKLQSALKKFQTKFQEDQAEFNFSDEVTYYIVSIKFLNSWRDFCMSKQAVRFKPISLNEDLVDKNKKLKQGLKEKQDFQIVTAEVYNIFKNIDGIELKRTAIILGTEKRVPIYLNSYSYLCIKNQDLRLIDKKDKKKSDFSLKTVEESQNANVKNLLQKISQTQNFKDSDLRLWRIDKKQNLDTLFNYLKIAADRANYQYRIKGFGKKIAPQVKIGDLQIQQGDFFLIEVKENYKKWFLQSENEKKCEGCYDITELKFPCKCEKVSYCTQDCKNKDKRFHIRNCEYAELEELNRPIDLIISKDSVKGVVGLRNLGNTCFMNSCLQCLSNTTPLTDYFLKRLYEAQINRTNKLGTKGKLAKSYAKFIKGTWCDSETVFTPDGIKSAVSSINQMFSGYAQHDSQEFFSFLIDGLHEDLNRIAEKPYIQSVQSMNRPDNVVASESWMAHIRRNQSIITDLMTGQYKSKVTCPTCNKQSITFDPFITVTLPIPQKIINVQECFVIYQNFQKKTQRISFPYTKPSAEQWMKSITKIIEGDEKQFLLYLVSINEGIYKIGRESIAEIIYKLQSQSKNLFCIQLAQEDMKLKEPVELTGRFSKKGYVSQYENVWFKFPFFFEKETTNGLTIFKKMLKFLYKQGYNDGTHKKFFGGKSYQDYEEAMMAKRPFSIHIRHKKRLDRFYNRLEYKFQQQLEMSDSMTLSEVLEKIDRKDCELDIRFTSKQSFQNFGFQRLKDFDDYGKKIKPTTSTQDITVDINQCFETLRESEQLEAGNEWYCPNCKEHKQANKQMSIYKAPKILILHLKRFKQKGLIKKQKNQSKVIFQMELDMSQHLIDPLPMNSYSEKSKEQNYFINPKYEGDYKITCSKQPIYELYAVSNHYGGLGGGHYTAFAKNGGKWYDYNDSSVRQCSESSVCGSGAYMLFYKRKD